MATSIIQFRVDDELKNEAAAVYEKLGIDLSTAMRMFLKRSVMEKLDSVPYDDSKKSTTPPKQYKPLKRSTHRHRQTVVRRCP